MGGHHHHGEAAVEIAIERALPADADRLTGLAHAAKRHWRYAEADIALWKDALPLTPEFINRHPVYAARAGGDIVGFYAPTGDGATRVLEHFWVAPALRIESDPEARRVGDVPSTPAGRTLPLLMLALG